MKIRHYFDGRLDELRTLAKRGEPWVFLCASSFLEYLAKIWNGEDKKAVGYKAFLTECFFKVCPAYAGFNYDSGKSDLDVQMYHVMRCGIVHSFSLVPDEQTKARGGRDRSILLAHRASGLKHLQNYVNGKRKRKLDAAILVAEDFVEDIKKVTGSIFDEAEKRNTSGKALKANIRKWVKQYPPIAAFIPPKRRQGSGALLSTFTNTRIVSG